MHGLPASPATLRRQSPRQRNIPAMVRRDREARLELNPRRPLGKDRFAHLTRTHD
jgi:hypothetical protein